MKGSRRASEVWLLTKPGGAIGEGEVLAAASVPGLKWSWGEAEA